MTQITFAELLELLGHTEHTSLCHKPVGGQFTTLVNTPTVLPMIVERLPDSDVWFGINPITGPARTGGKRGSADDVTALACLWADLDVKPGACHSIEHAELLIADLSAVLGTVPAVVIHSGHGLQPLWLIDDNESRNLDPQKRAQAAVVLKRWGRLVATIAAARDITVDSVFDLPRILRVPGTINHKHPAEPMPAYAIAYPGAPLALDEIGERLDEYGVAEMESDATLDEPVDMSAFEWAEQTCPYAAKMIDSWATETPPARHPWMLAQATRIAAARRKGCLTHTDHQRAVTALTTRMQALCDSGSNARAVAPSEVADALRWGEQRIAGLADTHIDRELGNHPHGLRVVEVTPAELTGNTTPPAVTTIGGTALAAAGQPLKASFTDTGNAQRLIHAHGHQLRYWAARRTWLHWDGHRWAPADDAAPAMAAAHQVADQLPEGSKEENAHKRASLQAAGLRNMVDLARYDDRIRVHADMLDNQPYALNTPDGTIDLHTATLHPHQAADNHTKITRVGYQPDQPTPRWTRFLTETFNGDHAMIGYLQRILGYAATGAVTHHILPFLHGAGANGKTVLTDVLLAVLGDYAITLPSHVLIADKYSHDTELARLAGARVAVCSEVTENGKFDEEKVKSLTGGDRLSARFLYSNPFEFTPSHTLILHGNHQPSVKVGGHSFWRRLRLIPFENTVPEEQRVEGLAERLVAEEGPGILAWMVAGAQAARDGLGEPARVAQATADYEQDEDALGRFIDDRLHLAPGNPNVKADTSLVRKNYSEWCRANGVTELSAIALNRELRRRTETEVIKSNGRRFYVGVGLIDPSLDDDGRYGE